MKLTPKEFAERIGSNAWRWGLAEFQAATGIGAVNTYPDPYTLERFRNFQDLAAMLGSFDVETLEKLCAEPK